MIKVGSLYAGIGGICLGFKESGFELSWANERDKNACITYQTNFNHQLFTDDIMELDINTLPYVDVLTAGFPCQPFSVAGHRKGFEDTRGNHFFKIMNIVDNMRPKVIFLENVKNLKGHDNGNTIKVIEDEIVSRGYTFDTQVLNTKDYGNIPHNRERIFIIAFDKNIVGDDFKFKFPEKEELTNTIADFIEHGTIEEKYFYRSDKPMYDKLIEGMVNSSTIYQWRRQYVRENKSNVCPTLTANMGTGGHNVPLVLTDKGIRKLTPRECFSFQGFSNTFNLPSIAMSHLYKQAGNSVSVPVIKRLATEIKKNIENI